MQRFKHKTEFLFIIIPVLLPIRASFSIFYLYSKHHSSTSLVARLFEKFWMLFVFKLDSPCISSHHKISLHTRYTPPSSTVPTDGYAVDWWIVKNLNGYLFVKSISYRNDVTSLSTICGRHSGIIPVIFQHLNPVPHKIATHQTEPYPLKKQKGGYRLSL